MAARRLLLTLLLALPGPVLGGGLRAPRAAARAASAPAAPVRSARPVLSVRPTLRKAFPSPLAALPASLPARGLPREASSRAAAASTSPRRDLERTRGLLSSPEADARAVLGAAFEGQRRSGPGPGAAVLAARTGPSGPALRAAGAPAEPDAEAAARARRAALRGKTILVVGSGYEGKRFFFEKARELGVRVILADRGLSGWGRLADLARVGLGRPSRDHWARGLVGELIPSDNSGPEALAGILRGLRRRGLRLDGITTAWEDDITLTADLARALGLPFHSPEAARLARSKFETQRALKAAGLPHARHEVVGNLSRAADAQARRAALERFRAAAESVGFPAVLKPEAGAAAVGTEKVGSLEEALAAYERISALVSPERDAIFTQNDNLVLMQYLSGREGDLDLVLQGGEAVWESLTDNKPTREPSFLATGSRLPDTFSPGERRAISEYVRACARALGLSDGVLHAEFKMTAEGPRLIEVNLRMGGAYVRDWVLAVHGLDLAEETFLSAAGIRGRPFKAERPLLHLDGNFINASRAGRLRRLELPEAARRLPGFVRFRTFLKPGDLVSLAEGGGYARAAMVEASGATPEEAARNLAALEAAVILEIDPE